jgi:hypothetical protein
LAQKLKRRQGEMLRLQTSFYLLKFNFYATFDTIY